MGQEVRRSYDGRPLPSHGVSDSDTVMCSAKTNRLGEGRHRGGMVADITFTRFHFFLENGSFLPREHLPNVLQPRIVFQNLVFR